VADHAAIGLGDRLAEFVGGSLKEGFASLLRGREFAIRGSPAIGTRRKAAQVADEVGQGQVVVVLGAPEIFLRARTALSGQVRIAAVPLVGLGAFEVFDGAIVDDVAAEAVWFEVPGEAVKGGIDVAVGAADLALEGIAGGVERLLAVARNGNFR
jgi:hypothetical protein